jgi:hypothetical protein
MIREQGRLLGDRTNRDVAIGGRLQRRLGGSSFWARSARRWLSARSRAVRSARRLSGVAGAALVTVAGAAAALRAIIACSIPVATTETRMMPSRVSSKVAPTMMLAS